MATATYPSGYTGLTQIDKFIPELWSDEVVASYKGNLMMGNLVSKLPHNGKKGDLIHIPVPTRGSANSKAAGTAVTNIYNTETEIQISINKHYEYSRFIEDIAAVQALESFRRFYTDDAGYALAIRVDRELFKLVHYLNAGNTTPAAANLYEKAVIGSDGSTTFDHTASSNTGNGATLTDIGIRKIMQTLDDSDTPMTERVWVLPPVEKKNLLGIPRFTEQAFTGEMGSSNSIRTGYVGDLYGVPVYVSSQCPWVHVNSVTGTASVSFTSTAPTGASYSDEFALTVDWNTTTPTDTKYRIGVCMHKGALVYVEQMAVRSQAQYKQDYLATLYTADTIFGVGRLRDGNTSGISTAGLAVAVPA